MAMRGGPRLPVGSAAWIAEERSSALNIAQSEIEEFSFSARNEVDWLNEHMGEIFSENQMNVAELFKTPGKLRGRTPRTAKKVGEVRVPLSDVFTSTPKGMPKPFALSNLNRAQTPRIKVAEDRRDQAASRPTSPSKPTTALPQPVATKPPVPVADSGYHGSQSDMDPQEMNMEMTLNRGIEAADFAVFSAPSARTEQQTPTTASVEETFQSAKEEQTRAVTAEMTTRHIPVSSPVVDQPRSPVAVRAPMHITSPYSPSPKKMGSPHKSSPQKSSPLKPVTEEQERGFPKPTEELNDAMDEQDDDEIRSPSDTSSPIRPVVRKSSLNFASLPAREPLTSNKSLGPRMSRTSHLGASFYRTTGGKSLGNVVQQDLSDDDQDEMDLDEDKTVHRDDAESKIAAHNKTYTQRLQDQISMLGKSQSIGPRPKSIAHMLPVQQNAPTSYSQPLQTQTGLEAKKPPSPQPKRSLAAPGAFPEDDDDDWIAPPQRPAAAPSPRPELPKSHSADVMEGVAGKETVSVFEFPLPRSRPNSPGMAPVVPERTTSTLGHNKSASVPTLPMQDVFAMGPEAVSPKKIISVSNPPGLATVSEDDGAATPFGSPSRTFRDSPLKQAKNKLSSILKSSKGLLARSAAISAEGKTSLLSPSTSRLGYHPGPSVESFRTAENIMYPDLSHHGGSTSRPVSPARTNSTRRTRASAEREKKEQKEKDKEAKEKEKEKKEEAKEARRLAEQLKKLEKVREKEQEKARNFSKEQDRIIAMEKRIAAQKEQERAAQAAQAAQREQERAAQATQATQREQERAAQAASHAFQAPAPPPKTPRSPPKATRTSPRKAKAQAEAEETDELDIDMVDAPVTMPPPSVPRSAAPSIPRQGAKRPVKPTKESLAKSKQAPTLIRVNTNSQFLPSNSVLASTLQETLNHQQAVPARQLNSKASQHSLATKPSLQSLNGSASTSKRPRALDMAAKRKAEEERETQRKREIKLENDRKRAAAEEERRQEQQRKVEAEKQEEERRKQTAKKAAIERAKQTKAPPPASRSQPNGPPEYSMADKAPPRPVSRLGSTMHQDRPVNAVLGKAASKRPLQDEENSRPQQLQRNPQTYQSQEPKRMRMSEEFDDDIESADTQRNFKGSSIRPPSIYKTAELQAKQTVFSNGYGHVPPQSTGPKSSGPKDLFRTTVTKQHTNTQMMKATNPMDMTQVAKGDIPGLSHKTPVRPPGAKQPPPKSAARSSPRFQNGDAIELPDIQTDDEDEDDDDGDMPMAPWANSPALRAALARQENLDPMQIFGPPAPLNMEEVFNKDKGRWHKFRARTSSANWSGTDRLTEEEVRKDLIARDKMRREGGWSYELSKEL